MPNMAETISKCPDFHPEDTRISTFCNSDLTGKGNLETYFEVNKRKLFNYLLVDYT